MTILGFCLFWLTVRGMAIGKSGLLVSHTTLHWEDITMNIDSWERGFFCLFCSHSCIPSTLIRIVPSRKQVLNKKVVEWLEKKNLWVFPFTADMSPDGWERLKLGQNTYQIPEERPEHRSSDSRRCHVASTERSFPLCTLSISLRWGGRYSMPSPKTKVQGENKSTRMEMESRRCHLH